MSRRYKLRFEYRPHYLRQWREFHGLSLDQMIAALGTVGTDEGALSKPSVSRIENNKQPYGQDVLEAYARVLGCEPWELLARPPADPEALWKVWNRLRSEITPPIALAMFIQVQAEGEPAVVEELARSELGVQLRRQVEPLRRRDDEDPIAQRT